jgi:hypothetical protein
MDMEAAILAGLLQRGLAPHHAQGIVANMIAESRLDPGINEIAPLVPGSRGGFGLSQWTGPRRRALEAAAQQRGVPVNDKNFQLDFMMDELQGPENRAFRALQGTQNAVEAARVFSDQFLRPGIPNMGKRLREASRLSGMPMPDPSTFAARTGGQQTAELPLSMGEELPAAGLAGLFAGASPLAPMTSPVPPQRSRRDEEAEQAKRRRQALFGAGGLSDLMMG